MAKNVSIKNKHKQLKGSIWFTADQRIKKKEKKLQQEKTSVPSIKLIIPLQLHSRECRYGTLSTDDNLHFTSLSAVC